MEENDKKINSHATGIVADLNAGVMLALLAGIRWGIVELVRAGQK